MRSIYQRGFLRVSRPFKVRRGGQLRSFSKYLSYVQGKSGLEIGGPSEAFRKGNILPIYEAAGTLDNCDFSKSTEWAKQHFHNRSLDNFLNRCLHHHVFDERNSRKLLSSLGFEVLSVELTIRPHICILARTVKGA
jgi:hypothetical protein